jgi:hypothetical protein
MIVKLRKSRPAPRHLTRGQLYPVIGIEADSYRIIDDDGQPYLFEPDLFQIVDAHEPSDWATEYGEDGERYAYPPAMNRIGFFEDYHDGDAKTVATFWRIVNRWLAEAG